MKKYLLLLALFVVGCSNSVGPSHIAEAEKLCKNNNGLRSVQMGTLRYDVFCYNGAIFEDILKTWPNITSVKDGQVDDDK